MSHETNNRLAIASYAPMDKVGGLCPRIFTKAKGALVFDESGRNYIDFCNGKGSVLLGHNHPLVSAIFERVGREDGWITCGTSPAMVSCATGFSSDFFSDGKVAFFKTGTSALRATSSFLRRKTGRSLIVSAGYHGWDSMWATTDNPLRCNHEGVFNFYFCLDWLAQILHENRGAVAGVIVSPDHSYHSMSYYRALSALCKESKVELVADEVKVGYRYGHGSLLRAAGIEPDYHIVSKCVVNGSHLALVIGTSATMEGFQDYCYTSYFETPPYLIADGVRSFLREYEVQSNIARGVGSFLDRVRDMAENYDMPLCITGNGNLFQFVFSDDRIESTFYMRAFDRGLLFYAGDNQTPSFELLQVLDEALSRIELVFRDLRSLRFSGKSAQITSNEEVLVRTAWRQADGFPELALSFTPERRYEILQQQLS